MAGTDETCKQDLTTAEDPQWKKKREAMEKIAEIISGLDVTYQEMLWIFKQVEGNLTLTASAGKDG